MMAEQTTNELHEGDMVKVIHGRYYGKTGPITHITHSTGLSVDVVPLYLVQLNTGTCVFLRHEIERVEDRGVV